MTGIYPASGVDACLIFIEENIMPEFLGGCAE